RILARITPSPVVPTETTAGSPTGCGVFSAAAVASTTAGAWALTAEVHVTKRTSPPKPSALMVQEATLLDGIGSRRTHASSALRKQQAHRSVRCRVARVGAVGYTRSQVSR